MQEFVQEAEKAMATSFFKRKPDYDTAATAYDNAAKSAQYQKLTTQSIEFREKAADAHNNAGNPYFAAKALELAGNSCLNELQDPDKAAAFYLKAKDLYLRNNNADRAIEMLEKTAKAMEKLDPLRAVPFLEGACDLYEQEDKLRLSVETFKKHVAILLRAKKLFEALAVCRKLTEVLRKIDSRHLLMKNHLASIIIALAFGDQVEANKLFSGACEDNGWIASDEGQLGQKFLEAYENQTNISTVQTMQQLSFLDNEVAKVAKSLRILGAASVDAPAVSLTDDLPETQDPEEESDLC